MNVDYQMRNGLLYPMLQISKDKADDERPLNKYAMMWLKFMHEFHQERYVELRMSGDLLNIAHKVADETYEQIKLIMKKSNDLCQRLTLEQQIIREFVLIER